MSKIATLLFCCFTFLSAFSIEPSFDAAHQKALKNNKILMVLLVRKNNKRDLKILNQLIKDKKLSSLIEQKAVFTIIQEGTKQSYPIEMLYTTTYPALFLLDKNELFIEAFRGDIVAKKLEEIVLKLH